MKYSADTHFVRYKLDTYERERRDAVEKMLADPDNMSSKQEFFDRFADQDMQEDSSLRENMDQALEQFASGMDQAGRARLIVDIFACTELYGIAPEEYFQFRFYWKNDQGRREYMGDKERFIVFRSCYNFEEYEKIRNKWLMYQQIGQFFNRKCLLISGGGQNEAVEIEKFKDFLKGKDAFLFKPLRSSCGKGIQKIQCSGNMDVSALYQRLCNDGGGIADELLHQDKRLERFHPQSANSVRLIVVRDHRGKDHFIQSLFRMGQGESIVDNDSEAIRARIDEKSGCVYTCGFDAYGNRYISHPDSQEIIPGFCIPEWRELLDLAGRVMDVVSSYARFIGFDLILTQRGWSVIEINPFPQLVIQQIITGQGNRREMLNLANECIEETAEGVDA